MAESSANPSILHSLMSHPELFVEMLKQGQTYRVYSYFGRNMPISAEIAMFRPKQVYICRNKTISAEYSVSAEFRFFEMGCFGFRCFGKKSVSVGHYKFVTNFILALKPRGQTQDKSLMAAKKDAITEMVPPSCTKLTKGNEKNNTISLNSREHFN